MQKEFTGTDKEIKWTKKLLKIVELMAEDGVEFKINSNVQIFEIPTLPLKKKAVVKKSK